MQLELLFTPVKIGRLEIKNRIVMPPMGTRYADAGGAVTRRMIDYYVARALGGVGLVIVEAAAVRDDGKNSATLLGVEREDLIPGLRELATAVRQAGARVAIQLLHCGRHARTSVTGKPVVGASAIAGGKEPAPSELSIKEIGALAEAFGEAARRAKEAGFDAVELHGAHETILMEFLSPLWNKRTDVYGGSLENRLRFPLEVMASVRRKAGSDFPVIYRLNGEEPVAGGLIAEEAREASRLLSQAGVDAIHVSVGTAGPLSTAASAPMEVKQGWLTHLAEGVRQVVKVPVITVGRITDPRVAERILQDEKADLVAIGRGVIADPDWAAKAQRGAFADIRRCIGCNEGCLSGLRRPEGVTCVYNPEVGRERSYKIRAAAHRKRVVVVGGGPAGMEAARVAALRGHAVTLYEQESYLGGQLALAAKIPGRGEFGSLIRYYASQLPAAGVKIELDFRVNASFVEDLAPDALVIATGAKPVVPWTITRWTPEAVTVNDVVAGRAEVGQRALILGGGLAGYETALLLAERGRQVRVVEMLAGYKEHPILEPSHALLLFSRLKELGVEIFSCTQVRHARDGVAVVSHEDREELLRHYLFRRPLRERGFREFEERRETTFGDFDTLILALGADSEQSLAGEVRRLKIAEVYVIGDAARPQKALQGVYQGAEIGRRI
ncbi:MAG: FAD-dependent oxidoreductase [Chloroflexi bacterium]|nr:FAD-dependent oxidoreductase [Chloroflexota bacterium]